MSRTFTGEAKTKLTQLINEGCAVMHEIETLQGGLTDTIKAVAEELNVKPALINKAIKIAHKGNWNDVYSDFDDLETILVTVGKDK